MIQTTNLPSIEPDRFNVHRTRAYLRLVIGSRRRQHSRQARFAASPNVVVEASAYATRAQLREEVHTAVTALRMLEGTDR